MKLEIEILETTERHGKYNVKVHCPSYRFAVSNVTLTEARKLATDAVKDSLHFMVEENRETFQAMMEKY